MAQPPVIHLLPAPIPPNGLDPWSASGRTLLSSLSPTTSGLSAWVAPKEITTSAACYDGNGVLVEPPYQGVKGVYEPDKAVYMGSWNGLDRSLHKVSDG